MMLENLKLKLQEIRKQKELAMANYNAWVGAENLCLQLIAEIEENPKGGEGECSKSETTAQSE